MVFSFPASGVPAKYLAIHRIPASFTTMASPGPDIDSDGESDVYSSAEFPPFGSTLPSNSSATSYSMRSSSPVPSVLTMSSAMRAQAFILEYGRGINNQSEVYRLPADDAEIERLQKQHLMLRELVGKYPPILNTILADDLPGEMKSCLDLGCGSGGWIMEVAHDFPHVSCVAVDLVPLQSTAMPSNCRSEVDDVNLGLEHYYGDFNVVHTRLVASGIKDYKGYIDQISRVLRPGGLLCLGEIDYHVYDANKQLYVVDTSSTGPPWWVRWTEFMAKAILARGANPMIADDIYTWVSEHENFENVVFQEHWLPASPWMRGDDPESVRIKWLGHIAREDVLVMMKSARPLLLGSGMPEELLEEIEGRAAHELLEAKIPYYTRFVTVTAQKKHPNPS